MRCRNGHEIMQGDAFCVICGSTPGTPAENHVCANGHLVLPNSVFCSRCGSRVATDLANQGLEISNTAPFNQALNLLKGHEVLLAGCVGGIATLVVIIALIFGGSSGQTKSVAHQSLPACSDGGPCQGPMGVGLPWKAAPASLITVLDKKIPKPEPIGSAPGSFVWVSQDSKNPSWFEFEISANAPLRNSYPYWGGFGVTHLNSGTWDPVNGPYNQGGEPMPGVPLSVLSDFEIRD